jgi:UDP-N-acetylmuramate--alanine ligase
MSIGASPEAVADALFGFAGVPRRFEFRGTREGVTYIDDYAHLPTEVRAALATAKGGGYRRVVCVFQPHRYTRTSALAPSFQDAFVGADIVIVTDIYSAGEPPVPGINGKLVADAVTHANDPGQTVVYVPERDQLSRVLRGLLHDGDVCLTLGAGDLTTLPDELLADA